MVRRSGQCTALECCKPVLVNLAASALGFGDGALSPFVLEVNDLRSLGATKPKPTLSLYLSLCT